MNTEKSIGIEVSKTFLKAVCVNNDGTLSEVFKNPVEGGREIFAQLDVFIRDLKNRLGDFEKIGVAMPGLIHRQSKRVAFSTQNPEYENRDFLSELEAATNSKIIIENDANAAAYGEYTLGAGHDAQSLFYITLGTGIGGALIFDGKIWRGASGFAGEFGQIAVNSDGMKLEDVASTANIVRRTRSRFHQDSTSSLSRLDEEEIRLADVIGAAQKGDDFAELMLQRTGIYVGTAVASVINLLNTEKIIVGGKIMQAANIVLNAIIQRAKELSFAPSFAATEIVESSLGENAAAIGVALLSREQEL